MIALFFKTNQADYEANDAPKTQGQAALCNRVNHMLRENTKLAWMPRETHVPTDALVKKLSPRPRRFQFQIELA